MAAPVPAPLPPPTIPPMMAPTAAPSTPRSTTCAEAGVLGQTPVQSRVKPPIKTANMRMDVIKIPPSKGTQVAAPSLRARPRPAASRKSMRIPRSRQARLVFFSLAKIQAKFWRRALVIGPALEADWVPSFKPLIISLFSRRAYHFELASPADVRLYQVLRVQADSAAEYVVVPSVASLSRCPAR